MNRKLKEIAWLLVPVMALAAIVPGAHWYANRHKVSKVPRIESCYLRVPTAWEAYNGAKVGFTARVVAPSANASGLMWDDYAEISNARGEHWRSDRPSWNSIVVAGNYKACALDDDGADTNELIGGLNWQRIVGADASAQAQVVICTQTSSGSMQGQAARSFTLSNPIASPPLASMRHFNFRLKRVELQTSSGAAGRTHRFVFWVRCLDSTATTPPYAGKSGDWKLRFKASGNPTGLDFGGGFTCRTAAPDEQGLVAATMQFNENVGFSVLQKQLYAGGLLSINGGWPQRIRIELPQGLPHSEFFLNLPFTATLAPSPK